MLTEKAEVTLTELEGLFRKLVDRLMYEHHLILASAKFLERAVVFGPIDHFVEANRLPIVCHGPHEAAMQRWLAPPPPVPDTVRVVAPIGPA